MPSKYVNNLFYDPKVINEVLLNDGFEQEIEIFSSNRRYDLSAQSLYVNKVKQVMVRVYGNTSKDKDPLVQLDIAYDITSGKLVEQLELNNIKIFDKIKRRFNQEYLTEFIEEAIEDEDGYEPCSEFGDGYEYADEVIRKAINNFLYNKCN